MLTASLVVSALALATTFTAVDGAPSPAGSLVVAQDAPPPPPPLEEGFVEPPPPPSDDEDDADVPPPPDGEAQDEATEGVDEPDARESRRARRRGSDDGEGLDPLLTRGAQVGAGVATCGVCGVAAVGASCVSAVLTCPFAAIPFVGTVVSGSVGLVLCSGAGAAVGAVETAVGNLLGDEEAGYLWPVAAGAGLGAVYGSLSLLLGLTEEGLRLAGAIPTAPPGSSVGTNPLAQQVTGPIGLALGIVSLGLCTAACVAMPIVPALVYGMVAEPKGGEDLAVLDELDGPAPARMASAMAF